MSCKVVKKRNDHGIVLTTRDYVQLDAVQNIAKLLEHNVRNYVLPKLKMRPKKIILLSERPKFGLSNKINLYDKLPVGLELWHVQQCSLVDVL
jgi:hypothetical protein